MNILDQLNQYDADHPLVGDPDDPPNDIWNDFIFRLAGYNELATEALDPGAHRSDVFVADGKTYRYDQQHASWKEGS